MNIQKYTERTEACYLKEAKQLGRIRITLNLDYEIDRQIAELLRNRRKVLLKEIRYKESKSKLRLIKGV